MMHVPDQHLALGDQQVSLSKRQRYLGAWLLFAALWCGACSGKQTDINTPLSAQANPAKDKQQPPQAVVPPGGSAHGFDKTEVDLEYGPLESASRYHRPRALSLYNYDKTETDFNLGAKKITPSQSHRSDADNVPNPAAKSARYPHPPVPAPWPNPLQESQ